MDYLAADGISHDDMLAGALDPGAEQHTWFAGRWVHPAANKQGRPGPRALLVLFNCLALQWEEGGLGTELQQGGSRARTHLVCPTCSHVYPVFPGPASK